jgi:YidC/Oxa1 family membrane protein insertase
VPATGDGAGSAATIAAGTNGVAAKGRLIVLKNEVLALTIDTLGGSIVQSELLRYRDADDRKVQAVLLTSGAGKTYLAQTGLIGAPELPTHRTPFEASSASDFVEAVPGKPVELSMTASSGGVKLSKRYTLASGSYQVAVHHEILNESSQQVRPSLYLQLTRDSHKPPGESQFYSTYTGPAVYTEEAKFQKVDFADIEKGKAIPIKKSEDGWAGIIQHYFVVAWVPAANTTREFFTRKVDNGLYSVGAIQPLSALEPGDRRTTESVLYVGPQDQHVLEKLSPGLDLVVDYGWLTVIAKPLYWLLETLHGVVGNWGWAIVLLTIVVKLAFFPLQAASYRSMAKMKQVTPKMTALRDRFGDDRVKLNQAMMELYKTEKVNPMAGCLPIVVQIPVFISLYWVLLASVEMRDAPWIGWIQDLATPDPYYVLPIIMAATMFLQTRLNPTPPDPVQAKVMMFMPLIFSVMFFFFPAGLVLYWLVNNIFSIAQQWFITYQTEQAALKKTR